jgi:hypothetical protein
VDTWRQFLSIFAPRLGVPIQRGNRLTTLHYASGDNIDAQGNFTPAQSGFNLADVSSVSELNALPAGVKGLVWLDQGDGVTQSFIDSVKPFIGNPNVFGFFLKDEPDPTGQWNPLTTAANLKAESDWIHANVPGAKTFITMMNMGSSENPSFANTYTPANTHIDYFGVDPYPVRSDMSTVDYNMIDKAVAAAEAAGIPQASIVPVLQTFGGGNWVDDSGGHYVMPSAAQEQQMLAHWAALTPNPAFDYAYAWGSQNGDQSLSSSQALQNVFLQHNTSGGTTSGSTTPVDTTGGTTIGSTSPSGSTTSDGSTSGGTTTGSASSSDPTTDTSGSGRHHHHHGADTPVSTTGSGTTTGSTSSSDGTTSAGSTSGNTTTGSTASNDPTTSPSTDTTGSGHHHHHHGLDSLVSTTGSGTTTGSISSSGSTTSAGSTSGNTTTGSTASSDPTTSLTTDTTGSGHHHHHGLDFSQLVSATLASSGVQSAPATAIPVSTTTDTTSSHVADSSPLPMFDLTNHHGGQHVDHHAWHL